MSSALALRDGGVERGGYVDGDDRYMDEDDGYESGSESMGVGEGTWYESGDADEEDEGLWVMDD